MASAGWFRGRSFELIHSRSLLVRVNPTPSNLSERRAVLHALQHHGTVEVFKRLPTPSTFICAFAKRNETNHMLEKSPLTFKFISEPLESIKSKSAPGVNPVGVAAPINLHFVVGDVETIKREQTDPSTAGSDPIKTFTMWLKPSEKRYNHKQIIRRNPLHGRWPEVDKANQDFVYHALKEVVPESIAQHGLCDWTTGGQLSENVKLARISEENGGNLQIRDRIERRRNRERLRAIDDELTSWTSLQLASLRRMDASDDAFESDFEPVQEPAHELVDGPVDDSFGAEAISDPLRTNEPQNQGLDSQQSVPGTEDTPSNQAPESNNQRSDHDSMGNLSSREILHRILEMPKESKAAPALNPGLESSRSKSRDQSYKQQIAAGHEKKS